MNGSAVKVTALFLIISAAQATYSSRICTPYNEQISHGDTPSSTSLWSRKSAQELRPSHFVGRTAPDPAPPSRQLCGARGSMPPCDHDSVAQRLACKIDAGLGDEIEVRDPRQRLVRIRPCRRLRAHLIEACTDGVRGSGQKSTQRVRRHFVAGGFPDPLPRPLRQTSVRNMSRYLRVMADVPWVMPLAFSNENGLHGEMKTAKFQSNNGL